MQVHIYPYAGIHLQICRYTYTHMQIHIYPYADTPLASLPMCDACGPDSSSDTHIPICRYTYTHMQTNLPCVMHAARTLAQHPGCTSSDLYVCVCVCVCGGRGVCVCVCVCVCVWMCGRMDVRVFGSEGVCATCKFGAC